jgi:leucyl-tRNA synthetase
MLEVAGVGWTTGMSDQGDKTTDDQPAFRYSAMLASDIEQRWQDRWDDEGTFETPNPAGPLANP